jgi:hypothetical protein
MLVNIIPPNSLSKTGTDTTVAAQAAALYKNVDLVLKGKEPKAYAEPSDGNREYCPPCSAMQWDEPKTSPLTLVNRLHSNITRPKQRHRALW